ncbi:MAG: hypothetical protein K6G69_04185 [Lachnospiraceae bacterium]|nr:hypothetical protein [Lachnospiraceae bacterium]
MKNRVKTVITIIVLFYVIWVFSGTMFVMKNINIALSGKETYDDVIMKHFYNPPGEFEHYGDVSFRFSLLGLNNGIIWLHREYKSKDEDIHDIFESFSISVKRDGLRWYMSKYNVQP